MKITIIVTAILLLFGAFSTIFHDTSLVGNIGKTIGDTNIELFGYLAYVNLLLLFYPLYLFYKKPWLLKRLDGYVGWMLFFISLVLFQSLVVDLKNAGFVGREILVALLPFIGKAGMWLFWLMNFLLALVLVVDDEYNFDKLSQKIKSFLKKNREEEEYSDTYQEDPAVHTQSDKIMSLNSIYSTVRSIFQNPFNFQRKREIEDILHMPLDPVKEVEEEDDGIITPRYTKSIDDYIEPPRNNTHMEGIEATVELEKAIKPSRIKEKSVAPATPKASRLAKVSKKSSVKIVDELEENSKILAQMEKGKVDKPRNFRLPKIDFLQRAPKLIKRVNEAEIDRKSGDLLEKLKMFRINGDIVRTYTGPLVTTFEFKPAPDVKVSKILGLQDDLAMALSAETIRIQAPIPGRDVVGIEIPNEGRNTIYLRDILESSLFKESKSPLTVALGKDIVGNPFVTDLKKLPHLLIAGTTGSGKSVGINAMLISLLYRNDPEHLKLMMIDPKMLEFSTYNDIPHLITPVITEPKKAIAALANMVAEMERRYQLMAEKRTKNIDNYNEKIKRDGSGDVSMPFIVVIIDELADLMMSGGKEVENSIARLAQKSRACGIHLVVATQRPSVDVVTGIIKANLPSRLSYRVSQRIDSKVILDSMGAESLLGQGDGLFTPPGTVGLVRIHAPWVKEEEIEEIAEFLKAQREPEYDESYLIVGGGTFGGDDEQDMDLDDLYEQARDVILSDKKTSISYLQRKLQIGYNRSANLIDQLTHTGVLSEPNAKGQREIL
ncbi:MAG: DNA translocase FtsK [Sulfurovum sp.]|nr:DNA translocase FtsK [Sulfurovum sp.]